LVVLFVVAAAVATGYGWVAADRDARMAALQDAGFGARLAATEVGGGVASVRQVVDGLAATPGVGTPSWPPTPTVTRRPAWRP
jgi:hypothetical protein